MRHTIGTRLKADVRNGTQGHHVAAQIAGLQVRDIFRLTAITSLGLRIDAERAAETIEVVDVDGTQVSLQGIEHVRQRYCLALRLDPVNIGP